MSQSTKKQTTPTKYCKRRFIATVTLRHFDYRLNQKLELFFETTRATVIKRTQDYSLE